ncbi:MAG: adenine phosphoribosyltransferase [Candidatus Latescibacteria bacterium]|nr:adenine phosphoribosyltransferase [Candidatus Latescibacterota bacterium]
MSSPSLTANIQRLIREVPDFPKAGISFKDITTLLRDGPSFKATIGALAAPFAGEAIDLVVGVEARGFILGAPLALELEAGFVPVRKPGKLPAATLRHEYQLEYGSDAVEMHRDAIEKGQRVLLVDDVLATGGTMAAVCQLAEEAGGTIVGLSFLLELAFLQGREKLPNYRLEYLVRY